MEANCQAMSDKLRTGYRRITVSLAYKSES